MSCPRSRRIRIATPLSPNSLILYESAPLLLLRRSTASCRFNDRSNPEFLSEPVADAAWLGARCHSRLPGGQRLPSRAPALSQRWGKVPVGFRPQTTRSLQSFGVGRLLAGAGGGQFGFPASCNLSASAFSAVMTPSITSSNGIPSSAAPRTMSSRFTARAKALSFIFFFTEATSTS